MEAVLCELDDIVHVNNTESDVSSKNIVTTNKKKGKEYTECRFCFDEVNPDSNSIGCSVCGYCFHFECYEKWMLSVYDRLDAVPATKCIQCTNVDTLNFLADDMGDTECDAYCLRQYNWYVDAED